MGTVRAAMPELHATAAGWHTLANELMTAPPSVRGVWFQPSAAAVSAIHAEVAAARCALTERTVCTAATTTTAATAYTAQEEASAAAVDAIGGAL